MGHAISPETAAVWREAVIRAGYGHTLGVRALTAEEYADVMAVLRRAALAGWVVRGVVVLGLAVGAMIALYVAVGPQTWMPVLTVLFAALARGWWRAKPQG